MRPTRDPQEASRSPNPQVFSLTRPRGRKLCRLDTDVPTPSGPESPIQEALMPTKLPSPISLLIASLALSLLLSLSGCGDPAGTPCTTTGSGFTASHDCRHRCLSRWQLTCPSGERITPSLCTGTFDCEPGGCPDGQVCYHDDDPFDDRSFCVVKTICGPLGEEELAQWELDRVNLQADVRAKREEKEARKAKWRAENPDAGKTAPVAEPSPSDAGGAK